MKAAVMTQFREPLTVLEIPDPDPGPSDAIVRVEASGICRTDWHVWQGDWTWGGVDIKFPHVGGHEFGGVVEAVGSEVRKFKTGDRVTVPFHLSCGHCDYCISGRSNICYALGTIGIHRYGSFGHYALVPVADFNMVHLPDEVEFLSAAALGCRFMTAFHGVVDQGKVTPGQWVAVFGMGGLGLSVVQIAAAMGAQGIAVSRTEEKLAMAKAEGAAVTINASTTDPIKAVQDLTHGGAQVTIDALGKPQTVLPAIYSLAKGGRYVQLGMTTQEEKGMISLPVDFMAWLEWSFVGSVGCPVNRYPDLLGLVASGKLNPKRLICNTIPIEHASDVMTSMTDFKTIGYSVITSY